SRSPPSRRLSAATPATSTSTLSLHDALPISECLQLNLLRISGRNKIAQCCIKYLGRYLFHILGCSPKFSPRKCRFHIRTGERLQSLFYNLRNIFPGQLQARLFLHHLEKFNTLFFAMRGKKRQVFFGPALTF